MMGPQRERCRLENSMAQPRVEEEEEKEEEEEEEEEGV